MSRKVFSFSGFLHKTDEGVWILCDAPNLKSCCLKKHALATLEGDFSRYKADTAVAVEGVFRAGMLTDVAVHEKNGSFPYWSLGAVVLIICLWVAIKLRPKGLSANKLPFRQRESSRD